VAVPFVVEQLGRCPTHTTGHASCGDPARTLDFESREPVAGRVFLQGRDVAATNTSFVVQEPTGRYAIVVRCPGYPDAQTFLDVTPAPS
jgi:hypothetical protein